MEKNELKLLRDKLLLFNKFMIEKGGCPPMLIPAFEESSRLIEEYYRKGFAKGLKVANIDIDDQVTRHMPVAMANEIKQLFKEKLGIDYTILEERRTKKLASIVKRGKIKNREEYELVVNRVDEIYNDPEKTEELEKLQELLILLDKDDSFKDR